MLAALLAVLVAIHAVRDFLIPDSLDAEVLAWFAFIPARYEPSPLLQGAYPGGLAGDLWTFVTYAFLHGS